MRWVAAVACTLAIVFVMLTYVVPALTRSADIWVGGFWEWLHQLVPVHVRW